MVSTNTNTKLGELLAALEEVGACFEDEVPLLEARVVREEVEFLEQLVGMCQPILKYLDRPVKLMERTSGSKIVEVEAESIRGIPLVRVKRKWHDKHGWYIGQQLLLARDGTFCDCTLKQLMLEPHHDVQLVPREIFPAEAIELYGLAEIVSSFTKVVESAIRQKRDHLVSLQARLKRLEQAKRFLEGA